MARKPQYIHHLNVLVDDELNKIIDDIAEVEDKTRSQVIRELIADGLRARGLLQSRRRRQA